MDSASGVSLQKTAFVEQNLLLVHVAHPSAGRDDILRDLRSFKAAVADAAPGLESLEYVSREAYEEVVDGIVWRDTVRLLPLALVASPLCIFALFRSIRITVFIVLMSTLAVTSTFVLFELFYREVNVFLVGSLIFVYTIASVSMLHVVTAVLRDQAGEEEGAFREMREPFLVTQITTAAGTIAIMLTSEGAAADAALYCLVGVVVTFLICRYLTLPIVGETPLQKTQARGEIVAARTWWWEVAQAVASYAGWIAALGLAVIVCAAVVAATTPFDDGLLDWIRDSEIVGTESRLGREDEKAVTATLPMEEWEIVDQGGTPRVSYQEDTGVVDSAWRLRTLRGILSAKVPSVRVVDAIEVVREAYEDDTAPFSGEEELVGYFESGGFRADYEKFTPYLSAGEAKHVADGLRSGSNSGRFLVPGVVHSLGVAPALKHLAEQRLVAIDRGADEPVDDVQFKDVSWVVSADLRGVPTETVARVGERLRRFDDSGWAGGDILPQGPNWIDIHASAGWLDAQAKLYTMHLQLWRATIAEVLLTCVFLALWLRQPWWVLPIAAVNVGAVALTAAGYASLLGRQTLALALFAPIVFGVLVDDTTYVLWSLRRETARRKETVERIAATLSELGSPILKSAILLSVGFAVTSISGFTVTADRSLLTVGALMVGAILDLVLLPAIVVAMESQRGRFWMSSVALWLKLRIAEVGFVAALVIGFDIPMSFVTPAAAWARNYVIISLLTTLSAVAITRRVPDHKRRRLLARVNALTLIACTAVAQSVGLLVPAVLVSLGGWWYIRRSWMPTWPVFE